MKAVTILFQILLITIALFLSAIIIDKIGDILNTYIHGGCNYLFRIFNKH